MRLNIVIATPDQNLRNFAGIRKEKLVPDGVHANSYLRRPECQFRINALKIDNNSKIEDVTANFLELSPTSDGFILLIDDAFSHLADGVRDAVFVVPFQGSYPGKITQNRIGAILAPTLRHYAHLGQRLGDGKFRKILLLPLEIFVAVELKKLRNLLTRDNIKPGFGERLDTLLSCFRDRQVPKNRATYPDKFIRDDRPLFFHYGYKEHSFVEKHPPHTPTCVLNSDFRFGCRYNGRRHFNVSEEHSDHKVSGDFLSCHGQRVTVSKRTHVNVFPNGFL